MREHGGGNGRFDADQNDGNLWHCVPLRTKCFTEQLVGRFAGNGQDDPMLGADSDVYQRHCVEVQGILFVFSMNI